MFQKILHLYKKYFSPGILGPEESNRYINKMTRMVIGYGRTYQMILTSKKISEMVEGHDLKIGENGWAILYIEWSGG